MPEPAAWSQTDELTVRPLLDARWVLLLDTRHLQAQQALQRLRDVQESCQGAAPLVVLTEGPTPCDADWWLAGAFDCCAAHEATRLGRILARAAFAVGSTAGVHAQLRRLTLAKLALQATLDNLPAPTFVKDAQGTYLECNLAYQAFMGVTREQLIGKSAYQMWPPELARVYEEADRQLLAEGGDQVYEARVGWPDGTLHDVVFYKAVWRDPAGRVAGLAGSIFDITDRKRGERRLKEQADTDPLTGVYNRRAFMELATLELAAPPDAQQGLVLILLDVDHFKQINDRQGHAAGDRALQHLASTLRQELREQDILARLGGDEFALLVSGRGDLQALPLRLPKLMEAWPLNQASLRVPLSVSVGAVLIERRQHSVEAALLMADQALYEAKRLGRNRAQVVDARLAASGASQEAR